MIPLALLSIAKTLQYFFIKLKSGKGFPQSEDSEWYLNYAYSLMTNLKIGLHMNDILYFGYNILLTLLLAVFQDPVAVIFVQAVTTGLSVIFVYRIARMLFNRMTAVIASIMYAYSWNISIWAMYILSDSFFISLLLLNVYLLLMLLHTNKRLYNILFIATSLYMLLFRPTGVLSLFFIGIYLLIQLDRKTLMAFFKKYRLAIGCFFSAAVLAFVYMHTSDLFHHFITSLQFNAKMVLYNIYAAGWIYDHPSTHDYVFKPDYTINIWNSLVLSFIINNWDHISVLYGKKIIAFLGRWVWDTELRSISGILTFVCNVLPTVLFLIGTIAAVVNGLFKKASIVWLVILAVFVFCILLFIDGMYRYKAPALPFIFIVIAYGTDRIIREVIIMAKKYTGIKRWNKKKY